MSYGSKGARALCHTAVRVLGPCVIWQQLTLLRFYVAVYYHREFQNILSDK